MKVKDIGIGKRLGIGFGILVVFMVILVITGIVSTSMMNERLKEIISVNNAKIAASYDIKDGIQLVNLTVLARIVSKDESFKAEAAKLTDAARSKYLASAEKLAKIEDSAKGKEIIKAIKDNIASGKEANVRAMEAAKAGNTEEASSIFVGSVIPLSLKVFEMNDELIKHQHDDSLSKFQAAQSSYRSTMMFLIGLGVIVVAFAVVTTLVLRKSIVDPIRASIKAAQAMAAGKLNIDVAVDRKDEFGEEAAALKTMVEKWREIVGSLKQASDSMASASTELSASADLMSEGADQQAERSHQVATASQEMSQTVLDVASNASSIATTATRAATIAKEGGNIVGEAVREVKDIADTVEQSAGHITSLSELSHRIGEIIGIINDIADQTNLLALNAAIEAARAGEHGRGFAVVADEVRKLAERTTGATSEVSGIIREIQIKVESAVSSVGQVSSKVDRGVELSTKAGVELQTIVGSVEELQSMVQQIASAIEEMSSTSDQISRDIESISGISTETSNSSTEVAKASREVSKLGVDLQSMAKQFEI